MKLHDQSHDGSNPIGTILYYNSSQNWLLINHPSHDLPNLFDQSIFAINFYNQSFQSTYIELTTSLACATLPSQTYVCRMLYSYLLNYVWFRWLASLPIAHSWSGKMYHPRALLVAMLMKVLLDANKTSPLYGH